MIKQVLFRLGFGYGYTIFTPELEWKWFPTTPARRRKYGNTTGFRKIVLSEAAKEWCKNSKIIWRIKYIENPSFYEFNFRTVLSGISCIEFKKKEDAALFIIFFSGRLVEGNPDDDDFPMEIFEK